MFYLGATSIEKISNIYIYKLNMQEEIAKLSSSDLGETLCSLNFASRVRGIESGPARKQTDLTELFKYKQMVC